MPAPLADRDSGSGSDSDSGSDSGGDSSGDSASAEGSGDRLAALFGDSASDDSARPQREAAPGEEGQGRAAAQAANRHAPLRRTQSEPVCGR